MNKLAKSVAFYLYKNQIIDWKNIKIYLYGIELIFSGCIGVINIIFIGLIFDRIYHSIIYLLVLIPLRMYIGGYHADTHFRCNSLFLLFYIISLLALRGCVYWNLEILTQIVAMVLFAVILFIAPLENFNKPMTNEQKNKYRAIGCVLYIGNLLVAMALNAISSEFSHYINILLILIVFLLIIGKWKGQVQKNEAKST